MSKHVLITGAGHGLGAHLARRFAGVGWQVSGLGLAEPGEWLENSGIEYLRADLSGDSVRAAVADFLPTVPDLTVHCAVAYPAGGGDDDGEDIAKVFRVNATAPYLLVRDLLRRKEPGRFLCNVLVNSEVIYHADTGSGVYAASKAALKILGSSLADSARKKNASVATLLLGPLTGPQKLTEINRIAAKNSVPPEQVTEQFLRRSNPHLVIDTFIDLDSCFDSVQYIFNLGPIGNGMVCRLDGGSAGSLI